MSELPRSAAADVLGRLRGLRSGGELPRPAVRAQRRQALRLRSPRAHRHRRRVPRLLPELVHQQDEPIGDPACLPMHFVCEQARKRRRHRRARRRGQRRGLRRLRRHGAPANVASRRWDRLRRLPRIVGRRCTGRRGCCARPRDASTCSAGRATSEPLYWGLDVVFWDNEKDALLTRGPAARASIGRRAAVIPRGYLRRPARAPAGRRSAAADVVVELCNRLPELLLMRVDKLSMAHSIEARAPFLDPDARRLCAVAAAGVQDQRQHDQSTCSSRRCAASCPTRCSSGRSRASASRCPSGCAARWRAGRDTRSSTARSPARVLQPRATSTDVAAPRGGRAGPQLRPVVPGEPGRLVRALDRGAQGGMSGAATVLYLVDGLGLSGKTKALVDLVAGLDPTRYRATSSASTARQREDARSSNGSAAGVADQRDPLPRRPQPGRRRAPAAARRGVCGPASSTATTRARCCTAGWSRARCASRATLGLAQRVRVPDARRRLPVPAAAAVHDVAAQPLAQPRSRAG